MKKRSITKITVLLVMIVNVAGAWAQSFDDNMGLLMTLSRNMGYGDLNKTIQERQTRLLGERNAVVRKLSLAGLFKDVTCWSDGVTGYFLYTDDENPGSVIIDKYAVSPYSDALFGSGLVRRGNVLTVKGRGVTVSYEQIGSNKLLVFRNSADRVVDVLYEADINDVSGFITQTFDMHDLYDGVYAIDNGEHCVFGLKANHYAVDRYETDPGMFAMIRNYDSQPADLLAYGEGRVSHGDPSSPNYDKMPGGGGAGAIMGPMIWEVVPTDSGVHVKIVSDEPFVDHCPRLPHDDIHLKKIATPYSDTVNGLWPFASLRPLTRAMLDRFPTSTLVLIRGEIYARHGDTFKNGDTQTYFDKQSWYHRSNKTVRLTAIEKLNSQLIKTLIDEREEAARHVRENLLSVEYEYHGMAYSPYESYVLTQNDKGEVHLLTTGSVGDCDYLVSDTVLTAVKRIVEECRMYEYAPSYTTDMNVLDGERWSFTARYADQLISSSGRNAWPDNNSGLRRLSQLLYEVANAEEAKLRNAQ